MTATTKPIEKTEKKPSEDIVLVLDTTATFGERIHQQLDNGQPRNFIFQVGVPLEMPKAFAIKFLRDPAFKLVDAKTKQVIEYKRPPRQPDELGAGEQLVLSEHETVARFDELSTDALLKRVIAMNGGEALAGVRERKPLIDFLTEAALLKRRKATSAAGKPASELEIEENEDVAAFDEADVA